MKRLKALAGKRATKWTLGILAGLLLLWTVMGFLVLPPIIRHAAVQKASKALGRKVLIGAAAGGAAILALALIVH